jgi:hypothetical protein
MTIYPSQTSSIIDAKPRPKNFVKKAAFADVFRLAL